MRIPILTFVVASMLILPATAQMQTWNIDGDTRPRSFRFATWRSRPYEVRSTR